MNAPVQIGEILASKYRVEAVLGAGAMGVVVAARHVQLGSQVALKFMLPAAMQVRGAADRFIREARAAARLRGEHVARVTDFGALESGAPFIVMEFLEGADLDAVMQQRGPLPIAEALGYVLDVCKAMDEAHQAGIVHRDLKPKNLFLTHRPDGTPLIKVLDFGISKLNDGGDDFQHTSTKTGAVLGSPAFMSPEQIKSAKHVDLRADIYGLGAVIYYLVAKDYPFDAGSIGELFGSILYKEPRLLRASRPDAPPALEALVARCLQKEPDARFATVKELMVALRAVIESLGAVSTVSPAKLEMGALATLVVTPDYPPAAFQSYNPADSRSGMPTQSTLGNAAVAARPIEPPKSTSTPLLLMGGLALVATFALVAAGGGFLYHRHQVQASVAPAVSSASSAPSSTAPIPPAARAVPSAIPVASASASASAAPDAGVAEPTSRGSRPRRQRTGTTPATSASSLRHGALYDDAPSPNR